ncbi:zinc finger, CCHC-type containing protein [Tanacetum coccineum]
MAIAAMKHMASNFIKLDKFKGVDFRRWQKKIHFLFFSMSVVYVLNTSIPEDGGDDATVEQIRKRAKWDNDDYLYRGLILNCMSDSLFDIYQNIESSKELCDSLKDKNMAKDASSKKFLGNNFTNYKMTDSRPVFEQYNKFFGILERFTQHKMNMNQAIQVFCIIDKLPPSWKDFKHKKQELTLVELGIHLCIEESLRAQDNDKPKGNNVVGLQMQDMSKDGLIPAFDMDTEKCERGIECIFVGYAKHSKAFRFYIIEPNDLVSINSIIESRDGIFDENIFSSVPKPSLRIPNRTEYIGGSVVPKEVTKDIVQQPELELRKNKRNRAPKNFGPEFQLYLIEGTRDEVDGTIEKFKARLVIQSFKQNSGIDYFDTYALVARISTIRMLIAMASIHNLIIHQMDVNTTFLNGELDEEVYMNQPQGFIMPGNENKVDLTKEFLSSRFFMKDIGEADVILVFYGDWLPDVYTSNPVLEGYADASWISNTKDNSSTSGWVFLLDAGKEAEWLRNLILEIPLWSKPITPISIHCDNAAIMAKAYNQMYNGKSRHLGVKHSMIRELITNEDTQLPAEETWQLSSMWKAERSVN